MQVVVSLHVAHGSSRKAEKSAGAEKMACQQRNKKGTCAQVETPTLRTGNTSTQVKCKELAGFLRMSPLAGPQDCHLVFVCSGTGPGGILSRLGTAAASFPLVAAQVVAVLHLRLRSLYCFFSLPAASVLAVCLLLS